MPTPSDPARRRVPRWLLIAVPVLVLLAVVGGPYAYIHVVEGRAAAPLSVDATGPAAPASPADTGTTGATATATATSPAGLDGTWQVASGSTAGYRVRETLFGQSNTAVGRTTALTGSLTVTGGTVTAGSFSADLTKVGSDRSQRDGQFQGRIMDTAQYPTATFKITQPIALGSTPGDGVTVARPVTGDLTLHGVTRGVTFTVSLKKTGYRVAASGSIPVLFTDYGIQNPSFAGVVTTEDNGTLEFLLDLSPA